MRLQITCLVGNVGITDGMRLVERIRSKGFPVAPDFLCNLCCGRLIRTMFHKGRIFQAPIQKLNVEFLHRFQLFLSHCLAQRVGLSARKTAEQTRQKHYLFLINGNSIGVFEILFHQRMIVSNLLFTVFTLDKGGNIRHRPRTVKRVHCDKVFKAVGPQ